MSAKLTPKQAIFVREYLIDGNATRSAIAAGYSLKSAPVTGAKLLKNPVVAQLVAVRHQKRAERLDVTAERVLEELSKLAYFDSGKLYDANGERIPVHLLDDVTRAAVAAVEDETFTSRDGVTRKQKVKMADKGTNLERLGRYLKLFTDKVEHDGRVTLEQLVSGVPKSEAE